MSSLINEKSDLFFSLLDLHGNEYDLSHLIRDEDDYPWNPINTDSGTSRRFYINVCKPLRRVDECPGEKLTGLDRHKRI